MAARSAFQAQDIGAQDIGGSRPEAFTAADPMRSGTSASQTTVVAPT